jgi:drug/metabolite transporter (DMT)-like permease
MGAPIFTSIALTGAGLATLVHFSLLRPFSDLLVPGRVLALALALAVGATVMPTYLMNAALSRISAAANATISILSPVVTLLLAVIFLGEATTWIDLVGTALVLCGIAWFTILDRKG